MEAKDRIFYSARDYRSIERWKDVTPGQWNDPDWQTRNAIRDSTSLKEVIRLSPEQAEAIDSTLQALRDEGKEAMRITPYYSMLIQEDPFHPMMLPGEKARKRLDPVFWQAVPTPANLLFPNTGSEGSMSESDRSFGAVYQRYPNRVALFVAENTSCASYCVHCQRAKSLDASVDVNAGEINRGLFYIGYNRNIDEVLVTGGDAMMISNKLLSYVLEELSSIAHLRVIRIATRVPVVMPMGITYEKLELIRTAANRYTEGPAKQVYFMTHINHYQEITEDTARAVKRILSYGFPVRNQTVLLNHVNDNYLTLAETFRRMLWIGIHPYYLLQCHKEKGIAHFITSVRVGRLFMKHLQGWLSGIARPDYVANIEGGGGKIMLMPTGYRNGILDGNDEPEDESRATVSTWDSRKIYNYEVLGRATRDEYDKAMALMDKFIGRKGVFRPRLIITDEDGNILETTNRTHISTVENIRKAQLLAYSPMRDELPLTNPAKIRAKLELLYRSSEYSKQEQELESDHLSRETE